MIKISLPWIAHAMASIDRLQTIAAGQKVQDILYYCFDARQNVDLILDESIYSHHLNISRERGAHLNAALDEMSSSKTDQQRVVSEYEAWNIRYRGAQFKEVLVAELNVLPTFLVVEKAGYDINALIGFGHKLFPVATLTKCPEATFDMIEAGKALAFELSTACGFHIFRVTEAVLRRYWEHITDGATQPKSRTIGRYVYALEKKNLGDKRILETLRQLADLHRNPIIHPEAILTVEDAIETLGIARSAIGAMLRVMPDVLPTTTPQATP